MSKTSSSREILRGFRPGNRACEGLTHTLQMTCVAIGKGLGRVSCKPFDELLAAKGCDPEVTAVQSTMWADGKLNETQ